MKLKVCGMRESKNIVELIKLQPDFMGFIFHKKSPRNVLDIPNVEIPSNIKKVGVFVDKEEAYIKEKASEFNLVYIQLHGKETPKDCQKLRAQGFQIIKAFNVFKNFDFQALQAYEPYCDYFLFDAFGKKAGGNGITFNWELLQKYKGETPFLLSGGIDENMIDKLKSLKHPKCVGVDINSGFELKPAFKNIEKIKAFKKDLDK